MKGRAIPRAAALLAAGTSAVGTACAPADLVTRPVAEARFAPARSSPLVAGEGLHRPSLADLNADGLLDIVVAHDVDAERGRGAVAVFLGEGDGGFAPPSRTAVPASQLKLAVGDVDGDGALDVAVGSHDSYEVHLLLGDGSGALHDAGRVVRARGGDTPHTHSVVLADVDGDEHLDLLTTNADHGDVSVLLGDGAGRFEHAPGSPLAAGTHPYEGMLVRDVNGDGPPDVVVPDLWGDAVCVLLGDGSGRFEPARGAPLPVAPRPGSVAVGDVDGDGRADIAATHDGDPLVSVLRGTDAGFPPMEGSPFALDERAWDVCIADLTGDGRGELVLGGVERDVTIRSIRSPATGLRQRIADAGRGPGYLALGDLDGDGRLDLVTGNFAADDLSVFLDVASGGR